MKKFFKLFGIIAFVAVIGFSMAACDIVDWSKSDESSGNTTSGSNNSSEQQPINKGSTIERTYSVSVPSAAQAGAGAAAVARNMAEDEAVRKFRDQYPGYEIINHQSKDNGYGTLIVTITGRKKN
jgi:hypothetical protein